MVFGVVRQSGGTVRIRSRLREGTTVQVYLPRAMKAALTGSAHRLDARVIGGAHVLVVDDDPDVRWITAEEFREIGCTVAEVDSGRVALAMLERDEPCDLMVVDLMMPGLSGTDTVRLARRMRPALKALFVSGYTERVSLRGRARQRCSDQEAVRAGNAGRSSSDGASPGAGQRRAIATRTALVDFSRDPRRKGRIVAPPRCVAAPRALILEGWACGPKLTRTDHPRSQGAGRRSRLFFALAGAAVGLFDE
jgi:CheY-like chemotaxis protein